MQVSEYLNEYKSESKDIVLSFNPALQYEIRITDELLEMFNFQNWLAIEEDAVPKQDFTAMVYFDLEHNKSTDYSRVAVFQNGYAVIQINKNGEFGEKKWYDCCLNYDFFEAITSYIEVNYQ